MAWDATTGRDRLVEAAIDGLDGALFDDVDDASLGEVSDVALAELGRYADNLGAYVARTQRRRAGEGGTRTGRRPRPAPRPANTDVPGDVLFDVDAP
jgi:hypothetical protein